jgi:hypothetical protein
VFCDCESITESIPNARAIVSLRTFVSHSRDVGSTPHWMAIFLVSGSFLSVSGNFATSMVSVPLSNAARSLEKSGVLGHAQRALLEVAVAPALAAVPPLVRALLFLRARLAAPRADADDVLVHVKRDVLFLHAGDVSLELVRIVGLLFSFVCA